MAVIHKYDSCKKAIAADRTIIDVANHTDRFELCKKCAAPILTVLKKYKLISAV
jgi:hypothetical protein